MLNVTLFRKVHKNCIHTKKQAFYFGILELMLKNYIFVTT